MNFSQNNTTVLWTSGAYRLKLNGDKGTQMYAQIITDHADIYFKATEVRHDGDQILYNAQLGVADPFAIQRAWEVCIKLGAIWFNQAFTAVIDAMTDTPMLQEIVENKYPEWDKGYYRHSHGIDPVLEQEGWFDAFNEALKKPTDSSLLKNVIDAITVTSPIGRNLTGFITNEIIHGRTEYTTKMQMRGVLSRDGLLHRAQIAHDHLKSYWSDLKQIAMEVNLTSFPLHTSIGAGLCRALLRTIEIFPDEIAPNLAQATLAVTAINHFGGSGQQHKINAALQQTNCTEAEVFAITKAKSPRVTALAYPPYF